LPFPPLEKGNIGQATDQKGGRGMIERVPFKHLAPIFEESVMNGCGRAMLDERGGKGTNFYTFYPSNNHLTV
jgi:hypothetical protein